MLHPVPGGIERRWGSGSIGGSVACSPMEWKPRIVVGVALKFSVGAFEQLASPRGGVWAQGILSVIAIWTKPLRGGR